MMGSEDHFNDSHFLRTTRGGGLPPPVPEWRHFITQLNQDPGDGSTVDSGLGTLTLEEEDAKADTAGDEEVKGGDGRLP